MAANNLGRLQIAMSQLMLYPKNLKSLNGLDHRTSLESQLQTRSPKLFCEGMSNSLTATSPAVELVELSNNEEDYIRTLIVNAAELNHHLQLPLSSHRREPIQRLIFIHAPNSRKPLNITKEMFLQLLTWHNVMPSFLDFVFPFGRQTNTRDSLLMGFRSESRIFPSSIKFPIHELGRSGRHLEFCYSLKSVERTGKECSDPRQDWSVRQCSVHHSFDLDTEQSTWIVIKGNRVISDRFQERVREDLNGDCGSLGIPFSLFAASLALHRILAAWASADWHWYISDLEDYLKEKTEGALSASFEVELFPSSGTLAREKERVPISKRQRTISWKKAKSTMRALPWSIWRKDGSILPTRASTFTSEMSPTVPEATGFDEFSFRDLQNIQFVEERSNEMATILQANSRVLNDLKREYHDLSSSLTDNGFTDEQQKAWRAPITSFEKCISSVDQDLVMQQARVESLLRLVADRKNLLHGILQYRSMEASRLYAQKAQNSASRMEFLTEKTKVETVSMRIITLVTLFFLPGTFISTLMSTPIVNFDKNKHDFSIKNIGFGALKLYLVISLPLVVVTLLAWWAVSLREDYKDKKEREKIEDDKLHGSELA